ncbi:CocE/NonD family hydrolase [Mucilaginibacter sp. RS28]|uniref:CocE/NonD family hydrolase n=1 Tax=Mucilaginibacter straminoryzae TaxID=2932774 RepID=A0A9X1X922_9SPHI|nr:CocE/NonD family hydrolase [Mucilaginibacter straminoryzae]MCJ8210649.1 CocE/NonD family hydrolase [Mucilaginibacter straminoryzae]
MNRWICLALLCLFFNLSGKAQSLKWTAEAGRDSVHTDLQIRQMAGKLQNIYRERNRKTYLENYYRLQLLTGNYAAAILTAKQWLPLWQAESPYKPAVSLAYQLYARAKQVQSAHPGTFTTIYTQVFREAMRKLDDRTAYREYGSFSNPGVLNNLRSAFEDRLNAANKTAMLIPAEALALCVAYADLCLAEETGQIAQALILADCHRRYAVTQQLARIPSGIHLHVVTILKKEQHQPQPAAMQYTIYADSVPGVRLYAPAAYGYAGVVVYSRGKGFSRDGIVPFEHDGEDANQIITWIARQRWCNGKVGMFGGSYNGFTQWAAAQYHNPALKTIVPYVAAIPGLGLPMENNVFLNANYGWAFYATNNRYLDNRTYNDPDRWASLNRNWFKSGAAYNKIDSVDGTPNPWLQRWLQHPDYDQYWQQQVPYQQDFAKINIPVLTVEGYYDDGQISGLHYYQEHLKYNRKANHYLLIGPYDHFGTQNGGVPVLRDYAVDPAALISTREVTFQWLDYVLKDKKRPALIKGKVNYEVMGANKWVHTGSIAGMADKKLRLYLTDQPSGNYYQLSAKLPVHPFQLNDTVDLFSRQAWYGDYYPSPIIKNDINRSNGLFFVSEPFNTAIQINGLFTGELKAIINKRDMDITVVLYEVTPDGKYFQLSYFLGRASYAHDMTQRQLLVPGQTTTILFERTRLVSRQLQKGSRLLVVVNTDKNPFAQVNYGTGGDVAKETSSDGKASLVIKWLNGSYIDIPVKF